MLPEIDIKQREDAQCDRVPADRRREHAQPLRHRVLYEPDPAVPEQCLRIAIERQWMTE